MYIKAGVTKDKWTELRKCLEKYKIILNSKTRFIYPWIIGSILIFVTINSSEWLNLFIISALLLIWSAFHYYCLTMHKKSLTQNTSSIQVSLDGIHVKNETFEGILKWNYFKKVINDSSYYFLFEKDRLMPLVIDKDLISLEDTTILESNTNEKQV